MKAVLHSYSDIITNSSTTTFMWPKQGADKILRDIIKEIMVALNVKGEPEDYFHISLEIDDTNLDAYTKAVVDEYGMDRLYKIYSDNLLYESVDDVPIPPPFKIKLIPKALGAPNLADKLSEIFVADVLDYY